MSRLLLADHNLVPSLYNGLTPDKNGNLFNSIAQMPLIIANLIQILLTLVAALAVIFIIVSGIRYIISDGDPSRTTTAKDGLRNAVIGLVLSASAYIIIDYLARSF